MRILFATLLVAVVAGPRSAVAACPSLSAMVAHAEQGILEGRLEAYPSLAEKVDFALGCGPVATPEQVARVLLVQGVYQHFTGSDEGARLSFASALRLDPMGWNPDFGTEVEALYRSSPEKIADGAGELTVLPAPDPSLTVVLNGAPTALPASVPIGFHVVQVTGDRGSALAAQRALVLGAGEQVAVNLGVLKPPTTDMLRTRRKPAWPLVVAGGAAVLAGGTAGLARAQDGRLESATTVTDLDAAFGTQRALAAAAWTFGGLAAAGLGVWVVW